MKRVNEMLGINRLHKRGITGDGVTVAVLDSGISLHPDIRDQVIGFQDMIKNIEVPYDDLGHGTHVSGIIAGNGISSLGQYQGVAPKAGIVSIKVLNKSGTGKLDDLLDGIQWIIDNGINFGIRIVNMSFGAKYTAKSEDRQLMRAVEELWDLGYIVVASAGNNGPGADSISVPGCCERIITVGASDDNMGGMVNGVYRKNYSGRGNPYGNITKPDIVAPAYKIFSCSNRWKDKYLYISKTGTSMSTPIVSGVIALMLQENPRLTNYECKRIIKSTAWDLNIEGIRQGSGRINPQRIMEEINKKQNNNYYKSVLI